MKAKSIFLTMFTILVLFSALLFPIKVQNLVRADGNQFEGDDLTGTIWTFQSHSDGNFFEARISESLTVSGTVTFPDSSSFIFNTIWLMDDGKSFTLYNESSDSSVLLANLDSGETGVSDENAERVVGTVIVSFINGNDIGNSSLINLLNYSKAILTYAPGSNVEEVNTGVVENIIIPTIIILALGATLIVVSKNKSLI